MDQQDVEVDVTATEDSIDMNNEIYKVCFVYIFYVVYAKYTIFLQK